MRNDHILSETLSLANGDISYQDWDETLAFPTSSRSPRTLNAAENGTSTQQHLRWVNAGETGRLSTSNVHSKNSKVKKRKAADMEQVNGKSRTDKYWARSHTVLEKGKELEALTDAYVIVYTARPERVKDGKRRLFISGNLQENSMGSELAKRLCQRISKAMDDVNDAAIELAELSQPGNHQRKKARTSAGHEPAAREEQAVNLAVDGDVSLDCRNVAVTPSIPRAPQMSIPCPNKISPSGHTINLILSAECDGGTSGAHAANEVSRTQLWLDKSELLSLVSLLSNDSKAIQLFALGLMRKLVSSDYGVQDIHDAMAIPHLVELLDLHSASAIDVVCQSTLVLSRMTLYQHPCIAMVNAGAIKAFSRLLSCPIGNRMLVIVVTTIGHCAAQHHSSWNCHERFSRDVLQPLINLLLYPQAEVWLAAAMAIYRIAAWEKKNITQHLYDESVLSRLCHLFSKCTTGLELEKAALSITRIFMAGTCDKLDCSDFSAALNDHILPRLGYLLSHGSGEVQMGTIRALQSLAIAVKYWDNKFISEEGTFIEKLISLLASDNDELFVEAAQTAVELSVQSVVWDKPKSNIIGGSEFIISTVVPRLRRLLSIDKGWIAGRAAVALGKMVSFELDLFDNSIHRDAFELMIALDSVPSIICLLSSNNLDVVRATIHTIGEMGWSTSDVLVKEVLPTLVNRLARDFDSHAYALLNANIKALGQILQVVSELERDSDGLEDALFDTGVIPIVIRLLALQAEASLLDISGLHHILQWLLCWSSRSDILRPMFIDANGVRPLLQWITNLPICQEKEEAIDFVPPFIRHSRTSRMVFHTAGAEQLLSDYLSIWHGLYMEAFPYYPRPRCSQRVKEVSDALDLLCSESDSSESDSSDPD